MALEHPDSIRREDKRSAHGQRDAEGTATGRGLKKVQRIDRADGKRPRGVRLLDIDPELGAELDPAERKRAQRLLVVPLLTPEPGALNLAQLRNAEGVQGSLRALMLVRGSLELGLKLGGRRCTRQVSPPEIVLLDLDPNSSMATRGTWSAGAGTELAALDARFLRAGQRWPCVFDALLARAARQAHDAFVLQAISQLPRVETRLLSYFWWLADRHGRVRGDGVLIDRSFTHETLGQMVGAARPTVSLALKQLAEAGMLRAEHPGGWLLASDSLDELSKADGDGGTAPSARYEERLKREMNGRALRTPGRPRVLLLSSELALPSVVNFDVVRVGDEAAALYELARAAPDLVLLEAREPTLRLSQLLQALRLWPQLRMTRLLLLGSPSAPNPSIQLLTAAHEYIVDPTDSSALITRIEAQLALATARAAQADQDEARACRQANEAAS